MSTRGPAAPAAAGPVTAPVTAPVAAPGAIGSVRGARRAAGGRAGMLGVRAGLALLGVLAAGGGAIALYRHSITTALYGPYITPPIPWGWFSGVKVTVTSYGGPWIVGAAGVALAGGLLLVSALADLYRMARVRRLLRPPPSPRPR